MSAELDPKRITLDDSEAERPSVEVHRVLIRRVGDHVDLPALGVHHVAAIAYDAFVDKPGRLPQPCGPQSLLAATFTLEEFGPKYNTASLSHLSKKVS